jgi:CelD/BcsL family acetyltransferase involved in cellulose biosynthesis
LPTAAAFSRPTPSEAAAPRARPGAAPAFASVAVVDDIEAARDAWAEIAPFAAASPYQGFDFARLWLATIGAARRVAPLIVVARDAAGAVAALLPLGVRAVGPLRLASFIGGKDANFNLGLFQQGAVWSPQDLAALLMAAAHAARPRVDAFLFVNQPGDWQGASNPFAARPRQPSPSFAYKSALPGDFAAWVNAHASNDAQKKLRKKAKRLEAMGPVAHRRAADAREADRLLAAFFVQKNARMRALGVSDAYEAPEARAFLSGLAHCGLEAGAPRLELHGLYVGDRVVATFGALAAGDRLSGLFLSNDGDLEIARSSPGELIVQAVVRDAIARGFNTFDLGVGEARYKNEACEAEEPLFDGAFGVTALGWVAAQAFLVRQGLKRRVKRSPQVLALLRRLRATASA